MTIDADNIVKPTWCPGCGNFGILHAVNQAITELDIPPHNVLMVSGIGQSGKLPHYTNCNTLNMLHGRTLPAASAAKTANPELTVIAVGGDGDGYAEGGNHFIHTLRRNHDITYLVHNNQVYGLTKGQASPTSEKGFVTKTSLEGAWSPMNPIAMAIAGGASFIARGFAGDVDHLAGIIKAGIEHKGFALVDILQPCVSFNHLNTYAWYRERVYKIEESNYDSSDKVAAFQKAQEWGEKIPIGIIYRTKLPTFEGQLSVLNKGPLAKQEINPGRVKTLLDEFM